MPDGCWLAEVAWQRLVGGGWLTCWLELEGVKHGMDGAVGKARGKCGNAWKIKLFSFSFYCAVIIQVLCIFAIIVFCAGVAPAFLIFRKFLLRWIIIRRERSC